MSTTPKMPGTVDPAAVAAQASKGKPKKNGEARATVRRTIYTAFRIVDADGQAIDLPAGASANLLLSTRDAAAMMYMFNTHGRDPSVLFIPIEKVETQSNGDSE